MLFNLIGFIAIGKRVLGVNNPVYINCYKNINCGGIVYISWYKGRYNGSIKGLVSCTVIANLLNID